MKIRLHVALFLIAACAISTGASGQNVYKCGSTYSQTPCPDAQALQIDDKRTDAQKQASDRATLRDANAARALELERLQKERAAQEAAHAQAKANAARDKAETKAHAKAVAKQKKKKQENFTAMATEKPTDTTSKKAKNAAKP